MPLEIERVAVIGSGSWATAIVKVLHENHQQVDWYVREEAIADHLNTHHFNPQFLSSVVFNMDNLHVSTDLNEVVDKADLLVLVVPSAFLKVWLEPLTASLKGKLVVTAIKGIVPPENYTVAEYLNSNYDVPFSRIGVLSGPSHSEEVAQSRLSFLTFACKNLGLAEQVASVFRSHYIKTIVSTDIYGTEYAAVLKNIFAIAAGVAHGLGYGDNFLAVLVCNAQGEIRRFLETTYPSTRTVDASAYLGDLLVTCYSQFSRNRTFGTMIGKGYSVNSVMLEMSMVAEGYYATKCIKEINQNYGVEMPITDAMHSILYEGKSPVMEMKLLSDKLT